MKNIIVLFVILVVGFGCFGKKKEPLAPELAKKAMVEFNDEQYETSVKTFEKLLDWYPFDKLATLAEFKIAEAYFNMEQYDEAIMYYVDFLKLHPRNDAVPYVMFQIAQAYYNRVDTIDRDQDNAKFALTSFRSLIQKFPESEYAKKSELLASKCLKSIAGHELYVGAFYYKSKHYKAALKRFEMLLANYPGLGFDKEVNDYIVKTNKKIAEKAREELANKDKKGWLWF